MSDSTTSTKTDSSKAIVSSANTENPAPMSAIAPPPQPGEHVHDWAELCTAIRENTLGRLRRTPTQLSAYRAWASYVAITHGSVSNYLLTERLQWVPIHNGNADLVPEFEVKNPTPFANPADYKILLNDWPYGLEPGIIHICVWMKGRIEVEGPQGALTKTSRKLISDFLSRTFQQPMIEAEQRNRTTKEEDPDWDLSWERSSNAGGDGVRVLWFKNWVNLQSVRLIDHIHVLLRDPPDSLVKRWLA
jgi:hypothetical protein